MNKAARRAVLIADIARRFPNAERKCAAAYMHDVADAVAIAVRGTEWRGKERTIALRAYEIAAASPRCPLTGQPVSVREQFENECG